MSITDGNKGLSTFCNISGLTEEDEEIMFRVRPHIVPHLPDLTDRFYEALQNDEQTSPYIAGRLDLLKKTHNNWMLDLFGGNYGEDFVVRQKKIGEMHVRVQVPPLFVAASMSFLRAALPAVIMQKVSDEQDAVKGVASVLRLLDLCQYLIDNSYNGALMDNLGISPALLVRLQTVSSRSYQRETALQ
ncbi:MAG: hypothetical protein HKL98_07580 [Burkholderiales bacterium]|nr:hypothetical protein [Burkholderiales bacterium]